MTMIHIPGIDNPVNSYSVSPLDLTKRVRVMGDLLLQDEKHRGHIIYNLKQALTLWDKCAHQKEHDLCDDLAFKIAMTVNIRLVSKPEHMIPIETFDATNIDG